MGANDGQLRKFLMQTFNVRQPPYFDVENDCLRRVPGYVRPAILRGSALHALRNEGAVPQPGTGPISGLFREGQHFAP